MRLESLFEMTIGRAETERLTMTMRLERLESTREPSSCQAPESSGHGVLVKVFLVEQHCGGSGCLSSIAS